MRKRDVVVIIVILGAIYGGLYVYSGNKRPIYNVISTSMMHDEASYGRIGTIDPGDLIIARSVEEIHTWTDHDKRSYGDWGDVLIYYPNGERWRTPVIHRAIGWVEANETANAFPGCGRYTAPSSGYLTKGDHNAHIDQPWLSAPVDPSWVIGVARGEVPWIGLIGMGFRAALSEIGIAPTDVDLNSVPTDCWVMLTVILVLIGIVIGVSSFRGKG
jgi:signal peptidase